jgi:serine protease
VVQSGTRSWNACEFIVLIVLIGALVVVSDNAAPFSQVAGTIGALGGNNVGVVGMVPDNGICFIIARVFGEEGGASFSMILAAVRWSIQNGAHVINMSLSGDSYDTTAARVFADAYESQNRIMVAAAGNDGQAVCRYPACYTTVVSVAAVDASSKVASFSNFNNLVDLAAPGVSILSTVPGSSTATIQAQSDKYIASLTINSPIASRNGVSGRLRPCGAAKGTCRRSGGGVCLIIRGGNTFEEKALNCQKGGGAAAIVYNNQTGSFTGWIPEGSQVAIPVFAVDGDSGKALREKYKRTSVTVAPDRGGYAFLSGTSMAAPHVSK